MPVNLNEFLPAAVWTLAAFVVGAVIAWLLLRGRSREARALGRESRDAEVAQLAAARDAGRDALQRLQRDHDATQRELGEHRARVVSLARDGATLAGRLERLTQIEAELAAARADAKHWNDACQRAEQRLTETATRLQEQVHAAEERQAMLERVREEFADRFKALAGELLEEKSRKFSEHNAASLGTLLNPLREQLGDFRKTITDVYDKESRERQLLKHEIDSLKQINQRIGEDALNLTRALKGESRTQGVWGELVLERLLEASGLQKGREYETQVSLKDEEGGRPRPDVIVHLPEGRDLIIDSKVSLTAYERYCSAADDHTRGTQLSAHLASMRTHVRQLAERRYSDLPGVNSLEFVLMFVPVEAAFIEAVHHDDELHAFALERQVVIVTTSTLLATLRTVASLWRFDDRNRNAFEIAERAGRLYDKFVGFVEDIDEARRRLDAARDALAGAGSKLRTGRGNLVGQVEKLRELGARAGKQLPSEVVEEAQTEEIQLRLGESDSGT
ncbi:MAG TPA: DNA recombination protein RmuC [Rudaea sp.]|jgi:DNA recombination protein RmuC